MLQSNHELHWVEVFGGLQHEVVILCKSGHKIFKHLHASELHGTYIILRMFSK